MSAGSGTRAIIAALLANAGIAVAKFIGYLITGSSSMLAESVHSVADTSNQGLLLLGKKRSEREATAEHPFGFGRGAVFSLYEGVHKIADPHPVESPLVAIGILAVAVALESYSFRTAIHESRPLKGDRSWWRFIRESTQPELPVVLLEDFGALVGLVLALTGIGLAMITGNGVWDGVGTIGIGVLLGAIAVVLIIEMKSLLIGEGAGQNTLRTITQALEGGRVERVVHIKTQYLGPDELLVGGKIALAPGLRLEDVAQAIDDAEQRIRSAVPEARIIYLEPDLDRTQPIS